MGFDGDENYYYASPLSFLPGLGRATFGPPARAVRFDALWPGPLGEPGRSLAHGRRAGRQGVPNRVDPWGPDYDHDWPTWREMLPTYLDDLVP